MAKNDRIVEKEIALDNTDDSIVIKEKSDAEIEGKSYRCCKSSTCIVQCISTKQQQDFKVAPTVLQLNDLVIATMSNE